MSSGSVYILLLNWNGWKDTVECLESIFHCDYPNYRVIVCDNGSEDGSVDNIKAWAEGRIEPPVVDERMQGASHPPTAKPVSYTAYDRSEAESGGDPDDESSLVIIRNGENLGFSAGNNVGLRYATNRSADFIWLLNNDTVVTDHKIMRELVKTCSEDTICSTVTLDYYSDAVWYSGGKISWAVAGPVHHHNRRAADVYDTEFISGCNLFTSAELLAKMGLLDERFFVGMEDCVLSWKAKIRSYRLLVINKDAVRHKIGKTNTFSRFAIANSYLSKTFWVGETSPNIISRLIWLVFFVSANLLLRHTPKLLLRCIRREEGALGLIEYWSLSIRALLRGFRVKTVSQREVQNLLGGK